MWSCEYTNISWRELHPEAGRHTKLLCVRSFRLFQGTQMLNNFKDDLFKADSISITFDFQKNQERQETVTQEHPTDPDLCPVRSAASIIMFIVCMPGMSANTSINSFRDNSGEKSDFFCCSGVYSSRSCCQYVQRCSWFLPCQYWMWFNPLRLCHGSLFGWDQCCDHHAHREIVKLFISSLHLETSSTSGVSSRMIQREHFFTIPRF